MKQATIKVGQYVMAVKYNLMDVGEVKGIPAVVDVDFPDIVPGSMRVSILEDLPRILREKELAGEGGEEI